MVKKSALNSLLVLAAGVGLLLSLTANRASAGFYYWDPEGTATATAANLAGTWNTSASVWSTSTTGAQLATLSTFNSANAAVFCAGSTTVAGGFTVTVSGTVTCAGLFNGPENPPGYNVTLSGGTISLASGSDGICAAGSDGDPLIVSSVLAGSGQAVIEGTDQIYLNGNNTYTGGTSLGIGSTYPNYFSSIVNFNNNNSFGTGTITMTTFASGCAMVAEGSSAITLPNAVTAATANINIVPGTGGTTFSGPWSLGSSSPTIGTGSTSGNTLTISGAISGTGNFNCYNAGTMVFKGANTYSGSTSNSCPLVISGSGDLGDSAGTGSYAGKITNNSRLFTTVQPTRLCPALCLGPAV